MTDEVVLSVAERIKRRRELRDQNNGTDVQRQPRVEEVKPDLAIINDDKVETVLLHNTDVVEITATVDNLLTVPTEPVPEVTVPTRRRELAPPVARPENAVTEPPVPRQRRRIITEAELKQAPAIELPVKAEDIKVDNVNIVNAQPESRMERVVEQAKSASQGLIIGLLEHMRAGEQLLITRDGQGLWSIVLPTSVVGSYEVKVAPSGQPVAQRTVLQGRLPNDFEDSLRNPAYNAFQAKWRSWNLDQKHAYAKEINAPLPADGTDPKVYNMRLMMSVLATANLAKYKPEYATQAARAAAKDKALKGLPW
jgi:hypothetical protein